MRNLFVFIWRNYYFFLFLILEIVAFTLLIRHSKYQQAGFLNSAYRVSGSIHSTYTDITDYLHLKKINKQLADENTRLHLQSVKSVIITDNKSITKNDTVYKQQFEYLTAKVISSTVNKGNNYIMLNKGYRDGIRKDMGVITSNGVVGVVKDVSDNFCYVISMLSKKLKISGRIKKNNQFGSVTWNGSNYTIGGLDDVPSHAIFKKGDTIITSGNSYIFPEGIPIGSISDFKINEGESFFSIRLRFTVDYNSVNYVYVIKNLFKEEQDKLVNSTKDE